MSDDKKHITIEELKAGDGSEGTAYICYRGRVVDVSGSKLWKGGKHMNRHAAGTDLTRELQNAPHGEEVLDRYPQVGLLEGAPDPTEESPEGEGERMPGLVRRFPFLERHPHPMTVHFPLVFAMVAPLFLLLRLASGHAPFGETLLHCLGAGILFTPVAILTGLYTWWLNYMAQRIRQVTYKLVLTPLLFLGFVLSFLWRLSSPELLATPSAGAVLFVLLVLALAPLAGLIGWFGATMTFPIGKK
jgi:predicted heme/steroid binding protein/uncharacterized membrane protein